MILLRYLLAILSMVKIRDESSQKMFKSSVNRAIDCRVESSLILIFEVRANRVKIEDFRPSSESSQARARLSISNESCRMSQVKTRLAPSCQISTGGPRLTRFPVTRFHFTRAGIY